MEKEFVTYEQAVALKELGFDEECFKTSFDFDITYNLNVGLPLKQQVFRWFREKYDLFGLVHRLEHMEEYYYMWVIEGICYSSDWETYEKAENACIDKLIEIAK